VLEYTGVVYVVSEYTGVLVYVVSEYTGVEYDE
jgi:hypothetical protein